MTLPTRATLNAIRSRAGTVGVIMGGNSAEREISLKSGNEIVRALTAAGVKVVAIDWDGSLDTPIEPAHIDRYFIALHGRGGEDGKIQAVLDLMGVPYTGSGVLGCALSMDKSRAKLAWLGAGLKTPDFELVDEHSNIAAIVAKLGLPLIIKPAREGSSFGVSKVTMADDVGAAIARAQAFDPIVLAEKFIDGVEYTLSIVADTTLPMIRLETSREFYDYEAKYVANDTKYITPCGLSTQEEDAAAAIALRAFAVLDGRGWGRVDFIRDANNTMWLIELNTVPGMTDHSLVPMAARQGGMSFADLVVAILGSSMQQGDLR